MPSPRPVSPPVACWRTLWPVSCTTMTSRTAMICHERTAGVSGWTRCQAASAIPTAGAGAGGTASLTDPPASPRPGPPACRADARPPGGRGRGSRRRCERTPCAAAPWRGRTCGRRRRRRRRRTACGRRARRRRPATSPRAGPGGRPRVRRSPTTGPAARSATRPTPPPRRARRRRPTAHWSRAPRRARRPGRRAARAGRRRSPGGRRRGAARATTTARRAGRTAHRRPLAASPSLPCRKHVTHALVAGIEADAACEDDAVAPSDGTAPPGGTLTVGVGAGGLATADMVLNIGPQHPSTHGVLRLRITLDGERIVSAEPIIGYMHRGAEKLFEVRDYRQILVLANRHDWLSAFSNELGVVLAAERMLGMEVPERALWARTLLAELNRVLNHLMFLGSYPLELGAITPVFYAFREREELQAVMEEVSGGRIHYMFNRVGGLKEDLPAGWLSRVLGAAAAVRARLPELESLVVGNEILRARTRGVGVLSRELAAAYGVSGPIARARRLGLDLPRDDPYLAYGELFAAGGPGRVVTRTAGDCLARLQVLLEQVHVSLDLAAASVDRLRSLPPGPVNVRLPKVLRVPEGQVYRWTENPLGINGYYLVSRGDKVPWRLKLRSASFNNVQVLSRILPGCLVADMVAVLGSTFFVVGDVDK